MVVFQKATGRSGFLPPHIADSLLVGGWPPFGTASSVLRVRKQWFFHGAPPTQTGALSIGVMVRAPARWRIIEECRRTGRHALSCPLIVPFIAHGSNYGRQPFTLYLTPERGCGLHGYRYRLRRLIGSLIGRIVPLHCTTKRTGFAVFSFPNPQQIMRISSRVRRPTMLPLPEPRTAVQRDGSRPEHRAAVRQTRPWHSFGLRPRSHAEEAIVRYLSGR